VAERHRLLIAAGALRIIAHQLRQLKEEATTMRVIRIVAAAAPGVPCPEAGQFLKSYDPDGEGGRGSVVTTHSKAEAMKFPHDAAAMACWKQQSRVRPLRTGPGGDGMANRPLTAFTVSIEDA